MPGRYAKFEASSGLIASIDSYSYRTPQARGADAPGSGEPASQHDSASAEPHAEAVAAGG
jgi:hypothetical protein